jgi:hypothetical protein
MYSGKIAVPPGGGGIGAGNNKKPKTKNLKKCLEINLKNQKYL